MIRFFLEGYIEDRIEGEFETVGYVWNQFFVSDVDLTHVLGFFFKKIF